MARHQMVVDHADRLHESIDDGRADELEPAACQFLGDLARDRGLGWDLPDAAEVVDLGLATDEIPQQPREARAFLHDLEPRARGQYGALDLQAVAHDALVLHQALDFLGRVAGYFFRREAVE